MMDTKNNVIDIRARPPGFRAGLSNSGNGRQVYDTGRVLIGSAHVRPPPPPSADAERIQAALLSRPSVIDLDTSMLARVLRRLRGFFHTPKE